MDEVITDQDYKEKRKEIDNKLELLKQDVTHLNNDENAQIVLEQRLAAIQKRLEEGVVKQAFITEMVEGIESIIVFPDRLVIRYKPDKALGTGGPVLDSIDNMDGKMQRKLQTEVKLDDDFLYGTRKEAQNVRIMDYMRENPRITARMIAEKEKISLSAANAKIKRLRTKGKIHFRGAGGHGEWIVNEDNEE